MQVVNVIIDSKLIDMNEHEFQGNKSEAKILTNSLDHNSGYATTLDAVINLD